VSVVPNNIHLAPSNNLKAFVLNDDRAFSAYKNKSNC